MKKIYNLQQQLNYPFPPEYLDGIRQQIEDERVAQRERTRARTRERMRRYRDAKRQLEDEADYAALNATQHKS